ncbi:MAG: FAD-dependent thymidylate synthase [Dehalococcoidia bacterium]
MHVALIRYTPDPELTIVAAARISTSPAQVTEHLAKLTPDRVGRQLSQLISMGHQSPLEHANFTFSIEGISRVTSHQLVRHRLASVTQQSQRFISVKGLEFVTPPTIAAVPEMRAKYVAAVHAAYELYSQMQEAGVPAEDARYVLPSALHTNLVMTMNARELLTTCALRLCLKSQWEIVELFEMVKAELKKVAPHLSADLRPKCYKLTYCDEAKSCGLFPTLSEMTKPG